MSFDTEEKKPRSVGRPKTHSDDEAKERPKSFLIRNRSNTSLYEVYVEGGGEVPKVLKGLYTSPVEARKAAEVYIKTRRNFY